MNRKYNTLSSREYPVKHVENPTIASCVIETPSVPLDEELFKTMGNTCASLAASMAILPISKVKV